LQGITQYGPCFDHYRAEIPGQVFASGAGSLGWGLAASIGARQALDDTATKSDAIVACVTGDGSFMFGMPSASYWVSTRYKLPFLAVVLSNGGTSYFILI
jgi:thiamine pyrophosphate-dependent acetolactate synthase large subunit-like protein